MIMDSPWAIVIIAVPYSFCFNKFAEKSIEVTQGLSMIMPYPLRSMGSGPVPDGPDLQKQTQTIHYCCPLQLLFQ